MKIMKIKELTLLEEAKLRYPIGTKFRSVQYDSGVKISNNNIYEETYTHLPIIYCDGTTIYYNNKWAEIIEDFVLPEKWCIKQNTAKEVCDWFNKNGTNTANINGSWTYLNYPNIFRYYSDKINTGFTEITFEQFKKYVLKEETTVNVEEKVVEKDYEILSLIEGKFIYPCDKYSEDFINQLFNTLGVSIHSLKRLSDSEIFTIGDKVIGYNNSTAKIKTIDLVGEVSLNIGTDKHEGFSLKNLKKVKKPLFTTEDGVDIYENIIYYGMNKGDLIIMKLNSKDIILNTNRCVTFSTKEKAEEYILMNKPCLSLSDVWDNLKVKDQKEVMKFVKSKLNKNG